MTNIIFLDFDGPLLPARTYFMQDSKGQNLMGGKYLDTVAVRMINRLCADTKAKVVISSVWRSFGFDEVTKTLKEAEFNLSNLHSDWRLSLPIGHRSDKIKEWLENHPEVEKYICIDDECIKGHPLCRVTFEDGFLSEHYFQVQEHFGIFKRVLV